MSRLSRTGRELAPWSRPRSAKEDDMAGTLTPRRLEPITAAGAMRGLHRRSAAETCEDLAAVRDGTRHA